MPNLEYMPYHSVSQLVRQDLHQLLLDQRQLHQEINLLLQDQVLKQADLLLLQEVLQVRQKARLLLHLVHLHVQKQPIVLLQVVEQLQIVPQQEVFTQELMVRLEAVTILLFLDQSILFKCLAIDLTLLVTEMLIKMRMNLLLLVMILLQEALIQQ